MSVDRDEDLPEEEPEYWPCPFTNKPCSLSECEPTWCALEDDSPEWTI